GYEGSSTPGGGSGVFAQGRSAESLYAHSRQSLAREVVAGPAVVREFVPAELARGPQTVTVRAHDVAFAHLAEDRCPTASLLHHRTYITSFLRRVAVIELEDYRVL